MAKMSRVSLARKRELEQPDVILSFLQRATVWVGLHRRQTTIAAGALLAIVVIIAAGAYFSARSDKVAFNRLTQIMPVNIDDPGADIDKAGIAEEYRLLNKKYGGSVAGKIAGLKYADACYETGDYEKATAAYRKALSDFKGNSFFRILALSGLGYTYESSGDYDQAVTCFTKILDDPEATIKDEALFHLGRLYALKGDLKNSRAMFSRIIDDHPDSFYARIVRDGNSG